MRFLIPLAAALAIQPLAAQVSNEVDQPPQPSPPMDRETFEPQITIIQRGSEVIEEYRVNNQIYMIKVTPAKGYPYYLVDTDGDGTLDARRSDLNPRMLIPQWPLLRWK